MDLKRERERVNIWQISSLPLPWFQLVPPIMGLLFLRSVPNLVSITSRPFPPILILCTCSKRILLVAKFSPSKSLSYRFPNVEKSVIRPRKQGEWAQYRVNAINYFALTFFFEKSDVTVVCYVKSVSNPFSSVAYSWIKPLPVFTSAEPLLQRQSLLRW